MLIDGRNGNPVLEHRLGFAALEIRRRTVHIDVDLTGNAVDIKAGALLGNLPGNPEGINAERIQACQVGVRALGPWR